MAAVLDTFIGCALCLGFVALASNADEATLYCAAVAGIGLALRSVVSDEA